MFKKPKVDTSIPLIVKPGSSLKSDSIIRQSDSSTKLQIPTPRSSILSSMSSSADISLKTITSTYLLNIEDFEPFNKTPVSGGCGIINFVRNKKSGKRYAAKTSYQAMNENDNKYVLRELNILMKIQHPTIIHFEGFSLQDMQGNDRITLFTDFMERGTLADIIEKERKGFLPHEFDNTKRQIILVGVARGMMILHKNKVINRDLKPQNVLIDKNFKPLITDFSLSKFFNLQNSQNQSMATIGTYAYMAPEVIKGNNFNTKADVYAFGILMYEFVTGSKVIKNLMKNKEFSEYAFYEIILSGERPTFNPKLKIKPGFQRMIEQCWAADPNDRPTFSEIYSKLILNNDNFYVDYDNNVCESIIKCDDDDDDDNDKSSISTCYCYDDVDFDELFQYVKEISETTNNSKDEEIMSLKQKVDKLIKSNQQMQEEINELKIGNSKMKSFDQLNKSNQKMQEEINQLKMENSKMRNIDQLNKNSQQMQEEIDKLKIENSKMRNIDQLIRSNQKMQEEINQLKAENSKMKNENQKLEYKISQISSENTVIKNSVAELAKIILQMHNSSGSMKDLFEFVKLGIFAVKDSNNTKPQASITLSHKNFLSYANGARVTYISLVPYNTNSSFYVSKNGGYTGNKSPVYSDLSHSDDNFWGAKNGWNVQGSLENDDSKNSIALTHNKESKKRTSATTVSVLNGSATTTIIIINPRAYYGDISKCIYTMSECYLASADSDGDVGEYKIYVSTKNDISVATNPNDSSWSYLTGGSLTTDGFLKKVYNGEVNFRFIKLALNNRGKQYMELAAIKIY